MRDPAGSVAKLELNSTSGDGSSTRVVMLLAMAAACCDDGREDRSAYRALVVTLMGHG